MLTWQYRVMRKSCGKQQELYGIFEFYPGDAEFGDGWSATPVEPYGEDLESLEKDLHSMMLALSLPVLDWDTGEPLADKKDPIGNERV